jgi:hypothetical protein
MLDLASAFDFQPDSKKCGHIFTAFSGILRTEERMFGYEKESDR